MVEVTAPLLPGQPVFPLTLRYGAVMHEVRNHSATVFWQSPGLPALALGLIRLDPTLGTSPPLILPAAP